MDAEQKLYPYRKNFTKLSCLIKLFQLKVLNNLSDKINQNAIVIVRGGIA